MNKYEHCCQCGERTGKAGKGEDSLYLQNGVGPYCETCFEPFNALEVEIANLRAQIERAFQMLEINGVPRDRAKYVSNGIDVLATRLNREIADLRARCEKAEKDAERLRAIRELCGYVEDGSEQTVRIFQDDATKDWLVCFGQNGREFARSFESAIDAAIAQERT